MLSILIPHRPCSGERQRNYEFTLKGYEEVFYYLDDFELITCDDPDRSSFNRGRAIIEGLKHATGDLFLFGDADIVVRPDKLREALELARAGRFVIPHEKVAMLNPRETSAYLNTRYVWGDGYRSSDVFECARPTGGVNLVSREVYEACGGFDPAFRGWGYEDAAIHYALETYVGDVVTWLPGISLHLYHPPAYNPASPLQQAGLARCRRYMDTHRKPEQMWPLVGDRLPK